MRPHAAKRALDRSYAVFVERAALRRDRGQTVVLGLVGLQRPAIQKGDTFVQDRGIAGGRDVVVGDEGQPQVVVREFRADATARGRVPPVLHIPRHELVRCGAQDLLAHDRGFGMDERHDILQLVAEAICAAGLVKRRARPDPAGQRLVE